MPPSFLQSAEWERFERSLGHATWRVHGALVIRRDLPLGFHYLYCPRPNPGLWDLDAGLWNAVREIARKEKSVFLKIDPLSDIPASHFQHPASGVQPAETIVLDLANRTEDELLAAMREKTRYNIRLAERKGVKIMSRDSRITTRSFEIFWRLLQETAARDGFRTHPKEYYAGMLAARSEQFANELFFAEYGGEVLAVAMINYYRGEASIVRTATYLHGASSRRHRDVMAPHLLQWRMIQEARQRGCGLYDFWGIDEQKWPGVTRFKRGFGGREIMYPQSVDIVYRPIAYAVYNIAKKIKS